MSRMKCYSRSKSRSKSSSVVGIGVRVLVGVVVIVAMIVTVVLPRLLAGRIVGIVVSHQGEFWILFMWYEFTMSRHAIL